MNKSLFGLLFGGFLGIFEGLLVFFLAPGTAASLLGVVIASVSKGLLVGLAIGVYSRFVPSVPRTLGFGLVASATLSFWIAFMQDASYLAMVIPGALLGLAVAYATQRFGGGSESRNP